jgi:RNA polymerase sigma-70 factor (ECF subfamily)
LKDTEAAKDVTQECFLKLLQIKEEIPQEKIQAWLYRECRCRAIDLWRKTRRLDRLDAQDEQALGFADSNPLQKLEIQRDLTQMHASIARLSARHREVLFLKYKEGLSYKEIAEVMGLTATNVGFILHEAMTALREGVGTEQDPGMKRKYGE